MDFRDTAAKAWAAFNVWRVKGWPFRVVVLLLIFAMPLYESLSGDFLVKRLVSAGVEAILLDCEPKLANAKTHYYNVRDIQALRYAIRSHFDMDNDGVLGNNEYALLRLDGMNPARLFKPSTYANASMAEMESLARFAKRYDIVPRSYNAKELRKQAFYAGLAEVQAENAQAKSEIANILASRTAGVCYILFASWEIDDGFADFVISKEPVNYHSMNTWMGGVKSFLFIIFEFLSQAAPLQWIAAWMFFSYLAASFIAGKIKGSLGMAIGLALPLACMLGFAANVLYGWSFCLKFVCISLHMGAYVLLSAACALKGARNPMSWMRILSLFVLMLIFFADMFFFGCKTCFCLHTSFLESVCDRLFGWMPFMPFGAHDVCSKEYLILSLLLILLTIINFYGISFFLKVCTKEEVKISKASI